jgi:hypothetical protein
MKNNNLDKQLEKAMEKRVTGDKILNMPKHSPFRKFRKELEEKIQKYNIKNQEFIENLVFDVFMSITLNKLILDVIRTDYEFSKKDKNYDSENCTYNNKPINFEKYILLKYGRNYVEFMKSLI